MAKGDKFFISKLESFIRDLSPQETKVMGFDESLNYNKKLTIILYGEPIADSRPRVSRGVAISINIGILRKFFIPVYETNELLKRTIIKSPYHLSFRFYMSPTKKLLNNVKRNKIPKLSNKVQKKFFNETIHDMSIKDCDNMVKVYNDLFMTEKCRMTIDDGFNVGLYKVDKFVSPNKPRVEIDIYFSTCTDPYYHFILFNHRSMLKYELSLKNMYMYDRTPKDQLKYLEGLLKCEFKHLTKENEIKDLLKFVISYFEDNYSAELLLQMINSIGNNKDYSKLDRRANLSNLLMYLFKHNKIVYPILTETMKKFQTMINSDIIDDMQHKEKKERKSKQRQFDIENIVGGIKYDF